MRNNIIVSHFIFVMILITVIYNTTESLLIHLLLTSVLFISLCFHIRLSTIEIGRAQANITRRQRRDLMETADMSDDDKRFKGSLIMLAGLSDDDKIKSVLEVIEYDNRLMWDWCKSDILLYRNYESTDKNTMYNIVKKKLQSLKELNYE